MMSTLDNGGAAANASIIENGEMLQARFSYEVPSSISVCLHRMLRGNGHFLRILRP